LGLLRLRGLHAAVFRLEQIRAGLLTPSASAVHSLKKTIFPAWLAGFPSWKTSRNWRKNIGKNLRGILNCIRQNSSLQVTKRYFTLQSGRPEANAFSNNCESHRSRVLQYNQLRGSFVTGHACQAPCLEVESRGVHPSNFTKGEPIVLQSQNLLSHSNPPGYCNFWRRRLFA